MSSALLLANQETLTRSIVPGTSVLLGMGRVCDELWSDDPYTTRIIKKLGREISFSSLPSWHTMNHEVQVREDGYSVNYGEEQWLRTQGQRHIKQIACGVSHVLLLEFNGRCWALGGNNDGQLGLGHFNRAIYPTLIQGDIKDEQIEYIEVGGNFSAFLSTTGQVFTCGNIARQFWNKGTQSAYSLDDDNRRTTQCIPKAVIMPSSTSQVRKIGCGTHFLLMQDLSTMNVYFLGHLKLQVVSSTTGTQVNLNQSVMHYVHPVSLERNPINFPCKKIDAGSKFSVVLDDKGKLFAARLSKDYTCVEFLYRRDIPVIEVCCDWTQFMALDAAGYVHVGTVGEEEKVTTLFSLWPVNQIGSGSVLMYARSKNKLYKMAVDSANDSIAPEQLQFDEGVDLDENTFVKLTGTFCTTIIHQAVVKNFSLPNINLLRQKQLLCDVTIICANEELNYNNIQGRS